MMNSNPWNVGSIDDFSYFNCPECTFHTKEKTNFQDHAENNHPLSSVLFCKPTKVTTFSNRNQFDELNQFKNITPKSLRTCTSTVCSVVKKHWPPVCTWGGVRLIHNY